MSQDTDDEAKKAKAERAKIEGNKASRAKYYDKALELYNIAIELDSKKVIITPLQYISQFFYLGCVYCQQGQHLSKTGEMEGGKQVY